MKCPKCGTSIVAENLNVQTDVGLCQKCKHVFKISEQIDAHIDEDFNIYNTPDGTWIKNDFSGTILGASTRSPIAIFMVPFMLVWSGGSLGGIYGTQILKGEFDALLSLFGIPFLIGSIVLGSFTLMFLTGKVELTLDNQGGKVFTGIGKLGWTRSFLWTDIDSIKESSSSLKENGKKKTQILMEGKKRISLGAILKPYRLHYLLKALRNLALQNHWI